MQEFKRELAALVRIRTLDKPLNTNLVPIIMRATHELNEAGFSDPSGSQIGWDSKVVYAEYGGDPIGFICWSVSDWIQEANILLAYVLPEYRRLGVYSRMFEKLEDKAVGLKLRSIVGFTSAENFPLQKAALKQGRKLVTYGYRKMLVGAATDSLDASG